MLSVARYSTRGSIYIDYIYFASLRSNVHDFKWRDDKLVSGLLRTLSRSLQFSNWILQCDFNKCCLIKTIIYGLYHRIFRHKLLKTSKSWMKCAEKPRFIGNGLNNQHTLNSRNYSQKTILSKSQNVDGNIHRVGVNDVE